MAEPVRAVDRALDILLCFTREQPSLSLTQIAEAVCMSKTTVHRLLATLESKRFVAKDKSTGLYRLGFRLIEMASLVLQDVEIQRWARPYLQNLSNQVGETVDLAILDGLQVVYLDVIESPQRIKLAAAVGQRLPAFCTASGKAMLAYLPEETVRRILSEDTRKYTDRTEVSIPDILEDLRVTAERGYAVSEEQYERDINAVAAPIFDAEKRPVAAIAIVGPSFRMPKERFSELGKLVCKEVEAISDEVGHVALSVILNKVRTP